VGLTRPALASRGTNQTVHVISHLTYSQMLLGLCCVHWWHMQRTESTQLVIGTLSHMLSDGQHQATNRKSKLVAGMHAAIAGHSVPKESQMPNYRASTAHRARLGLPRCVGCICGWPAGSLLLPALLPCWHCTARESPAPDPPAHPAIESATDKKTAVCDMQHVCHIFKLIDGDPDCHSSHG
jgi:hypothetical protein